MAGWRAVCSIFAHHAINLLVWFLLTTTCDPSYCLLKARPNLPGSFHIGHWNNPLANNFWVATKSGCPRRGDMGMKGSVFHYHFPEWPTPYGDWDFLPKMKMYHLSLNALCLSGVNEPAFNDSVSLGRCICVGKVDRIIGISSHVCWNPAASQ